jgi:hypothetical protein
MHGVERLNSTRMFNYASSDLKCNVQKLLYAQNCILLTQSYHVIDLYFCGVSCTPRHNRVLAEAIRDSFASITF